MASKYKFSSEEIAATKAACRETKDKRADARLKALELRAEGLKLSEVAQAAGFHAAYVSQLVAKYRDKGLEAVVSALPFSRLPLIPFSALPDAIGLSKRFIRF